MLADRQVVFSSLPGFTNFPRRCAFALVVTKHEDSFP